MFVLCSLKINLQYYQFLMFGSPQLLTSYFFHSLIITEPTKTIAILLNLMYSNNSNKIVK
jgi:hypothetical protein